MCENFQPNSKLIKKKNSLNRRLILAMWMVVVAETKAPSNNKLLDSYLSLPFEIFGLDPTKVLQRETKPKHQKLQKKMNCLIFFFWTWIQRQPQFNPFDLYTVRFVFEATFQNFWSWLFLGSVKGDKIKTSQAAHKFQNCDIFLKTKINDMVLSCILY